MRPRGWSRSWCVRSPFIPVAACDPATYPLALCHGARRPFPTQVDLVSMTAPLFKGVITALITPLRDGNVDEAALDASASSARSPPASTASCRRHHRRRRRPDHRRAQARASICVQVAAGRVPVIAGAGSPATDEGDRAGARTPRPAAPTAPWWSRPTTTARRQEGLIAHFEAITDAVQLPLILSTTCPARTGVDISNETRRPAGGASEHRRHQGRHRRHDPRQLDARQSCGGPVRPALRRRPQPSATWPTAATA